MTRRADTWSHAAAVRPSAFLLPLLLGILHAEPGHAQSGAATRRVPPRPDLEWSTRDVHLGLVHDQRFVPLDRLGQPLRLTAVPLRENVDPEAAEIGLSDWEGLLIAVTGQRDECWVYSVEIREKAGYVVSGAVRRLWGGLPDPSPVTDSRHMSIAAGSAREGGRTRADAAPVEETPPPLVSVPEQLDRSAPSGTHPAVASSAPSSCGDS